MGTAVLLQGPTGTYSQEGDRLQQLQQHQLQQQQQRVVDVEVVRGPIASSPSPHAAAPLVAELEAAADRAASEPPQDPTGLSSIPFEVSSSSSPGFDVFGGRGEGRKTDVQYAKVNHQHAHLQGIDTTLVHTHSAGVSAVASGMPVLCSAVSRSEGPCVSWIVACFLFNTLVV